MSNDKETFTKVFEELLSKSIEANKVFLNEGARFIKRLSNQDLKANNFNIFQRELLSNTLSDYVKLNLNYFNNVVDLGLNFIKNVNNTENDSNQNKDDTGVANNPSFVLEKETEAGQSVSFQFLLDNVKEESVTCRLIHSGFSLQADPSSVKDPVATGFKTVFTPQTFDLHPGESKSVSIAISIPEETVPGLYTSKVQVKGFEPAYFSIQITVTKTQKKQTPNGGKKEKSGRK
jgi:hypothetical protein